jgi:prevent-host-death family protein
MTKIGVRELRQNASLYLDMVKTGETVEVTERGILVALLVPPTRDELLRNRLVSEGKLIPAKHPINILSRKILVSKKESASETLAKLREERS